MAQSTNQAFRPATISEYIAWLRGHLANGGKITHAYDYPFSRTGFLVARQNFTTDGECGADAAQIIVLEGCQKRSGALGHNELYLMDGFGHRGHWVPVFDDAEFDTVPGIFEAREEQAGRDRAFREASRTVEYDSDVSRYRSSPAA